MKIAVLSDIHGNYLALQECLKHAKSQKVDRFLFLGDYLGEFPFPQNTMKILYDLQQNESCTFIRGNKEDYWLNRRKDIHCEWKNGNHSIAAMINNYENLTEKDLDFFESLPISASLEVQDCPSILICHGIPEKNNVLMIPEDEKVIESIQKIKDDYVLCGHTHYQRSFQVGEKQVWNPGAIGVAMSGTGSVAQYMIIECIDQKWIPSFFSIPFDINIVEKDIHESGLFAKAPYWCRITIHLMKTGTISHGSVLREVMKMNSYKDPWYNIPENFWEMALKHFGME